MKFVKILYVIYYVEKKHVNMVASYQPTKSNWNNNDTM